MKRLFHILFIIVCTLLMLNCGGTKKDVFVDMNKERGQILLDSLYKHYSVDGTYFFRDKYPYIDADGEDKIPSGAGDSVPNQYSYLWSYSGAYAAINAMLEATGDSVYRNMLNEKILPGLDAYYDDKRNPVGYSSYINTAPVADRFYDDNIWLGIDFVDSYNITGEPMFIDKAKVVWNFVQSGIDDKLDGGIYWYEREKRTKNTCSNAPGAVFALKLFNATSDSMYFYRGRELYEWVCEHLQDSTDHLFFDNISLDGKVVKTKYAYNSGQMMQAAVLLYNLTGDEAYLEEAQYIARSSYDHFFYDFETPEGDRFRMLNKGNIWFTAVMLRGLIELYKIDGNSEYIDSIQKSIDYAWENSREANGLFESDWGGKSKDKIKWLTTQVGVVEIYARLTYIDKLKKEKSMLAGIE